jgi:hypothetical protein
MKWESERVNEVAAREKKWRSKLHLKEITKNHDFVTRSLKARLAKSGSKEEEARVCRRGKGLEEKLVDDHRSLFLVEGEARPEQIFAERVITIG